MFPGWPGRMTPVEIAWLFSVNSIDFYYFIHLITDRHLCLAKFLNPKPIHFYLLMQIVRPFHTKICYSNLQSLHFMYYIT